MTLVAWWFTVGALMAWLDRCHDPEDEAASIIVVFLLAMIVWPLVFLALCEVLGKKGRERRAKERRGAILDPERRERHAVDRVHALSGKPTHTTESDT